MVEEIKENAKQCVNYNFCKKKKKKGKESNIVWSGTEKWVVVRQE